VLGVYIILVGIIVVASLFALPTIISDARNRHQK
jgi:hypothetical protein